MHKYIFSTLFIFLLVIEFGISREGKDYALFIAVKDYENSSWPDLRNPIRDAEAVAEELSDRYNFQTEILRNPSQAVIYSKLREYSRKSYASDSQLFIFFSGHGHYDSRTTEGFFIPKDGKSSYSDPDGISWVSHARLNNRIASIPCKHILLVIDACFSGTFDRRIAIGRNEAQVKSYVTKGMKYKTRLYITSGGKEYVSDGRDHSPFTRGLLSAFRLDQNGLVTFPELVAQLDYIMPTPKYGEFEGNQAGSNFYFIGENANIPGVDEKFSRPGVSRGNSQPSSNLSSNITDRDRNIYAYKTMKDGKRWMTKNLNLEVPNSYCYEGDASYCQKYGRLYTWEAAKKACAQLGAGWRLPTDDEWREMAKKYGGSNDDASDGGKAAYKALIENGSSGFAARLGGYRYEGDYLSEGTRGLYWSSTQFGSDGAWNYNFLSDYGKLNRGRSLKGVARSVRCLQD